MGSFIRKSIMVMVQSYISRLINETIWEVLFYGLRNFRWMHRLWRMCCRMSCRSNQRGRRQIRNQCRRMYWMWSMRWRMSSRSTCSGIRAFQLPDDSSRRPASVKKWAYRIHQSTVDILKAVPDRNSFFLSLIQGTVTKEMNPSCRFSLPRR